MHGCRHIRTSLTALSAAFVICLAASVARAATSADIEFFENRIRPVLAQECYECHRTEGKRKAGLALDHRDALRAGGDSGPVIDLQSPDRSLLLRSIRRENEDLQMPKNGAKLDADTIADFEKWIARGAPDPRDHPPTAAELAADTAWPAVRERRRSWWSFQPIRDPAPPQSTGRPNASPIDRFIDAGLRDHQLSPAPRAGRETLIRRLSFNLRGLPPSPEEIDAFLADGSPDAFARLVDAFLASPEFGERWARHWMDWLRYADSHGSEGDPMIPNAWRYRDYLIRALNADVPVDQLIREHLAGDLLERPRINHQLGLNESAIGPAHLRMVFHGFAPTDALDELVRFTDDQINVVSKAFMGLTVSCARCHDHKFDPISQADFHAWFGVLASARPAMSRVDVPAANEPELREQLRTTRRKLEAATLEHWLNNADAITEKLDRPSGATAEAIERTEKDDLLWPLALIDQPDKLAERWHTNREQLQQSASGGDLTMKDWDFSDPSTLSEWFHSPGSRVEHHGEGRLIISTKEDRLIDAVLPAGAYSHGDSKKDIGVLHSERLELDRDLDLWLLIAGEGNAMARYSVQHYPRDGTVYPIERLRDGRWRWKKFPLDYWSGDRIHVELTTGADQPVLADTSAVRSWFGIRRAVLIEHEREFKPANADEVLAPLFVEFDAPPESRSSLLAGYQRASIAALEAARRGQISDAQVLFLDRLLQSGLLPNSPTASLSLAALAKEHRDLEARLPIPQRAPGLLETTGRDQALFERGDHRKPLDPVPRRFLEVIDETPYATKLSGRRELAEDLLRDDNPLTARVMVNHVWHHLFGRGIVATPENFGRLGQPPSHPDLLDHLATQFRRNDWSLKRLIREIVLSETWQRTSRPSDAARSADPDNILLSHFPVRRLEAEAIRDALLVVSGRLDRTTRFGPPVSGDKPRRSIYVRVKRNDLDPFLTQFDAPVPASSVGARDDTNVPGQSLTLLNDPLVIRAAEQWGVRFDDDSKPDTIVTQMFRSALGRLPTKEERRSAIAFLDTMKAGRQAANAERSTLERSLKRLREKATGLESNARDRMVAARQSEVSESNAFLPKPVATWDFADDLTDQIGGLEAKVHRDVEVRDGRLVLDGSGFLATEPLPFALGAKTLEAWVQLDGLDQRGGGVISVQTLDGGEFDAIVFGEQEPRQWMAGSEFFKRTSALDAPAETIADRELVHVAITYAEDGTITFHRNGELHGNAYRPGPVKRFNAGQAQVLFGNRHGSGGGNRMLKGKITRARVYDRTLTTEEIAASFSGDPTHVSKSELWAALDEAERENLHSLRKTIEQQEDRLKEMEKSGGLSSANADLAHALFNLKEFIYVR